MKVAVVGCGHLGSIHARVYSQMQGVDLVGIHDIDVGRGEAVAAKLNCKHFGELAPLADVAEAMSVCVPTTAHHEVAMAAMARDCHLLVEKPIASDSKSALQMVDMANRRGLQLMVGHVERFNPAMLAALPYLANPGFVESHRLAPFGHRGAEVAVILDLMIHDIDLLAMVMGEAVTEFDASGTAVLTRDVDIANARLRFAGGCVANITASRISRERMRKIRFFQADSYLSVDLMAGKVEMVRKVGDFHDRLAQAMAAPEGLAGVNMETFIEPVPIAVSDDEPLALELGAFIQAVAAGTPVPVSGEDGLRALELALGILAKVQRAG